MPPPTLQSEGYANHHFDKKWFMLVPTLTEIRKYSIPVTYPMHLCTCWHSVEAEQINEASAPAEGQERPWPAHIAL
jgi:hypothetical protein